MCLVSSKRRESESLLREASPQSRNVSQVWWCEFDRATWNFCSSGGECPFSARRRDDSALKHWSLSLSLHPLTTKLHTFLVIKLSLLISRCLSGDRVGPRPLPLRPDPITQLFLSLKNLLSLFGEVCPPAFYARSLARSMPYFIPLAYNRRLPSGMQVRCPGAALCNIIWSRHVDVFGNL